MFFWDESSFISWNYKVTWILDFTPSPLTSSGDTVSDWKFGVVMSLLRQFATLGTLWCTFGWLEMERCGSFERRVLNKNTWQGRLGSWFFQSEESGSHHFLQSPCSITPCTSCSIYKCGSTKVDTSQIPIFIQCKSPENSNPLQLPKIQVLTYKIPLEGSLNLQPKNSASCMEIHMKPNHESLHHRNQEGKTEATMIPVTSSGARSIG